jgi:ABC-type bacteriocin/lantibiotic exporter with double-glycine peptidase domain
VSYCPVIVSIIVGGFIDALTGAAYGQLMQRKDTRVQLVKEVFRAIQVVKLQGWDARFTDCILALRERELETVWRRLWLSAVNGFVLWASPALVLITSFAVYTFVQKQRLTSAKVFMSMALFAGLRIPLVSLPSVLAQCFQAKISLDRMQKFLDAARSTRAL